MSENQELPQAPRSRGFNGKRLAIVGLVAAVVVVLIGVFVSKNISNRQAEKNDVSSDSHLLVTPTEQSTDSIINSMKENRVYGSLIKDEKPVVKKPDTVTKQAEMPAQTTVAHQQQQVDQDLQQALNAPTSAITATNVQHNPSAAQRPRDVNGALQLMDKALGQVNQSQAGRNDTYNQQNMQGENGKFLAEQQKANDDFQLKSSIQKPVSPYVAFAGGIIPATLQTGMNSDLPGQITAKINRNVFDTVTGNYLLIPQGTTAIGVYSSKVAYGQSRVLFAWKRLVFPNGNSLDLQGMPGADLAGYSGLSDIVNNHYWKMFSSVVLLSIFSAGAQLSQPQQGGLNNTLTNQQILFAAVGQNLTEAGSQMLQKDLNIQPTLEIRPGANFNILITRDMVFPGPYSYR